VYVQQAVLLVQLLTLLAVANGTPVIAAKLLGKDSALPLDGGVTLSDGKPLFGSSKTIRGVILSVAITAAAAPLIGLGWEVGCVVAAGAMIGDLFSSFLKRRLGMSSSSKFTGLDQIPEALLPLLASMALLPLKPLSVALGTLLFFVGALLFSRVFFKMNIRDRPY
jgi:CDP-2,3-bis-(O-geranylgeranyl)-sn-glycerol synthase